MAADQDRADQDRADQGRAEQNRALDLYYEALDRFASGEIPLAVAAFRQSLVLDPSLLDAMHGLIRALQDAGEFDEAIATAHRLTEADPEDVLAHTSLSILYQHKGMVPEAEAEALKAKLLGGKKQLARHSVESHI